MRRCQFALREGMQADDLHAAGQRVRKLRDQQDIGRTRQYETSRHAAAIHFHLQRAEECRYPLHLVQDHPFGQVGNKAHGVGLRTAANDFVIETQILVSSVFGRCHSTWLSRPLEGFTPPRQRIRRADDLREGSLARLARTMNEDDGRIFQRLLERTFGVARIQSWLSHRPCITFAPSNCKLFSV